MNNSDYVKAQYEGYKVPQRSPLCPRIGFYKLISLTNGFCLNKPAQLALVNWKLTAEEEFEEDLYFVIQLESLKKTNPSFDFNNHIGAEINITTAIYLPQPRIFAVEWELVIGESFYPTTLDITNHCSLHAKEEKESQLTMIEILNKALKDGAVISLSEMDDYDYDEGEVDDYFDDYCEEY